MFLTNDREEDNEVIKGQRTLATEFFQNNSVMQRVRTWLMNSTVLLRAGGNKASGVIIDVDSDKVYVLTAKHVLYTLSGEPSPGEKKPADYNNDQFFNRVEIGYKPADLLSAPAKTAAVTGLDFTGIDDQTWLYDIVVFTSTNADFRQFAAPMVFVDAENANQYKNLLKERHGGQGCAALDSQLYEFFQLGYGDGRDGARFPDTRDREKYSEYGGKLQCKISSPRAKIPLDSAFEPDPDLEADDWPRSNQICLMQANITNSSGPGDSGGPLFCRLKTDKNKVYLVGVTAGANFFSDEDRLPDNMGTVHNNAVTYWEEVLNAWEWN